MSSAVIEEVVMNGSYTGGGFGARGFDGGSGGPGQHLTDVIDQLRSAFEQRVAPRMARGDVRAAVLALLAEKPMHGYQIIAEIEQRSGGAWKPSAGSVYPTLQLLADEGLITAEAADGRKTYSLTTEGRAEADAAGGRAAPWEASGRNDPLGMGALPKAGVALAQAAAAVRRTGSDEQIEQAVTVLDEARRKLYTILAQD
jgi:DNA-binding PadR family transcriptional regulator